MLIRQESMIIKNLAKGRVHWFLDEGGVAFFLLRKEAKKPSPDLNDACKS